MVHIVNVATILKLKRSILKDRMVWLMDGTSNQFGVRSIKK